jgi:hypothetical protein
MPADMDTWQAEGDRLAILTRARELYVLEHDGRRLNVVRHIDVGQMIAEKMPALDLRHTEPAVLFNPTSKDTFYVTFKQPRSMRFDVPVEIVEFQGEALVTVHRILPSISKHELHRLSYRVDRLVSMISSNFEEAGENGLWYAGLFIHHEPDRRTPGVNMADQTMDFTVFFNTITREISTQGYSKCFDCTAPWVEPCFLWEGQRYSPHRTAEDSDIFIRSYAADTVNGEWKQVPTPATYEISASFIPLDSNPFGDLEILHDHGYMLAAYTDRYIVWSFLEEDHCTSGS